MKNKVYIKYHSTDIPPISVFGNWIDLRSGEDVKLKKGESYLIDLCVSMRLPKYYQANIVPRSSTFKNFGIIQANHFGVVDGATKHSVGYSGDNDRWKFNAIAMRNTTINKGDRICQFQISLTMDAPFWVKLKWLFYKGFKFIEVESLGNVNRGGFGSSGIK